MTTNLRDILLQLQEEQERHAKAIDSIKRQILLLVGDVKPRPKVTELVSPNGKVSAIKSLPQASARPRRK